MTPKIKFPTQINYQGTATIKTLRVDTRKLDQLVSQVGELIISKIKAKEHLTEVEKITRSIEDWYREWHKAKQIIKNIDRKPLKQGESSTAKAKTSIHSMKKALQGSLT
ncbi:MAG: hypothetical protein M0C28_17950 [Candidatus Moduliflexus flocculans]|nr:hypothetical protein [Candidatus Moduliflexus flocculans]